MNNNDGLSIIADRVRRKCPIQPWGRDGHDPVPLSIGFNGHRWTVRFVCGLKGSRRQWATTQGDTLRDALLEADKYEHS